MNDSADSNKVENNEDKQTNGSSTTRTEGKKGKKRKHVCDRCKLTFSHLSSLSRHRRIHQITKRRHGCKECGKTFASSENLKRHLVTHSG